VLPPLHEWETFYVIIGSSAAALTGLQFVVIALSAESNRVGGDAEMQAFATPTVVHFCAVLLVSAILSMPGQTEGTLSWCIAVAGFSGLVYVGSVVIRMQRTKVYKPVFEDWLWHSGLPLFSYASLLTTGIVMRSSPEPALYVVAAIALLLLFTGIHNAWDAAVFIAGTRRERQEEAGVVPNHAAEGGGAPLETPLEDLSAGPAIAPRQGQSSS
jgi:hypothetical protein